MGQLEPAQECYQQLLDNKTYQTPALQNIGVIQRLQQVPKPRLEPPLP
jgi:hypothetical protein